MFEDVAILIEDDIAVLVVLVDEVLPIVLVDRHSLVLQVADELLDVADVVAQAEELNHVLVLSSDVDDLLREVFTDLGEDVVFFSSELKEELQPADLCVLVDLMLLFVADFLQHLIVDLLQFLEHLVEGGPLFGVISKHIIGEVLPVGMEFTVILHPPLTNLIQVPLILEILEGLNISWATLTFWKRTFCMSIS